MVPERTFTAVRILSPAPRPSAHRSLRGIWPPSPGRSRRSPTFRPCRTTNGVTWLAQVLPMPIPAPERSASPGRWLPARLSFLDGCALAGLHSLRSFLDGCALAGLHSLRSFLDGCALAGLHSLRSFLDGCALA